MLRQSGARRMASDFRSSSMLSTGASTDVFVSCPAGTREVPGLPSMVNIEVLLLAASAATRSEYVGLATLVIDPLVALTTERVILHMMPPASPLSCCNGHALLTTLTGLSLIF